MTKPVIFALLFIALCLGIGLIIVLYFLPGQSCRSLSPGLDIKSEARHTFKPVVNLPWLNYGTDFGTVAAWSASGVHLEVNRVQRQFEKLTKAGITGVVWHLLADGRAAPEFDAEGNPTHFDPDFWKDYEAALALAEARGIGIFWVLLDFTWFSPATRVNGAALGGHADVIIDMAKRKNFFEHILEPLLKRQRRNAYINGWILVNEPENAIKEGYIDADVLKEFVAEASALIRDITCKQPVALGCKDLPSALHYWPDSDLDAVIFHHYESYLPPSVPWLYARYPQIKGKNIFNGEFFINRSGKKIEPYLEGMKSLGFAGAWPWSVNAEDKEAFALMADRYAALVDSLRKQGVNHRSDSIPRQPLYRQPGWTVHPEEMRQGLTHELAGYATDLIIQEEAEQINRNWLNGIEAHLAAENKLLADSQKQLQEAAHSLEENRRWLARTRKILFYFNRLRKQYSDELEVIRQYRGGNDIGWEQETLSALQEVEHEIELETAKGKDAAKALKSTQAWLEDIEETIKSFRRKIEALEAGKTAAHSALRRCQALREWDSFHIEYGKRILEDYIPNTLRAKK